MPDASPKPTIEFLGLPYASARGSSLLELLIEELKGDRWSRFRVAVAFVKSTGNDPELIDALDSFVRAGGEAQLTFGADILSGETRGSDFAAIQELVERFADRPNVRIHLYHERGRTFHPKIYLFDNEIRHSALLIVGSSNWSSGGLRGNVEANVVIRLDLSDAGHNKVFDDVSLCFAEYWSEKHG